MSSPYVGEIRMFGGNFAPAGWAFCDGQLIAISQNQTLYNLIATTFGGDGVSTFALPDLRGRVPIHQGQGTGLQNYVIGELFGVENPSTLQVPQSFTVARNLAVSVAAQGRADGTATNLNRLGVSFIISLYGVYPSLN